MGCACEQTIGGVDGGECDQTFVVTWPSDVDRLKARLAPIVEAMNAGVVACPALPAADRDAWNAFLVEWRPFAARKTPTFGSFNEWETACSYAHTIDAWRTKLASKCSLPGPGPIQGADTEGATVIKWVMAAVIAVAVVGGGVYAVKMFR